MTNETDKTKDRETPEPKEKWSKEFDELIESMPLYSQDNYSKIKSFIREEIKKAEQRGYEEGVEEND